MDQLGKRHTEALTGSNTGATLQAHGEIFMNLDIGNNPAEMGPKGRVSHAASEVAQEDKNNVVMAICDSNNNIPTLRSEFMELVLDKTQIVGFLTLKENDPHVYIVHLIGWYQAPLGQQNDLWGKVIDFLNNSICSHMPTPVIIPNEEWQSNVVPIPTANKVQSNRNPQEGHSWPLKRTHQ